MVELGEHGVRILTLKTGGIPETIPEDVAGRDEIGAEIDKATLLNWTATLADVGNVAVFVASDRARTVTATEVDISRGAPDGLPRSRRFRALEKSGRKLQRSAEKAALRRGTPG